MTEHDLITQFRSKMKTEIDIAAISNGMGTANDWGDYRYKVGIVKGMLRAMQYFDDFVSGEYDDK